MKILPGILFLLLALMSPYQAWADNGADAGDSSTEQADGKKKGKKKVKGEGGEEEPDCE